MLRIALIMLTGARAKYAGLIFGIAFAAFLITFAGSYFCGFMTRGYALIAENGFADVWVMDPAVSGVEQTINLPNGVLDRVRSVPGVQAAVPLVMGTADARFPNGQFQQFQVIGVDDATLIGAPQLTHNRPSSLLRSPDAVAVDPGGTDDKLLVPAHAEDHWAHGAPRLDVPLRLIRAGDELLVNDQRVTVVDRTDGRPRFPPRLLMYTTASRALRLLPVEQRRVTFVLANAAPGVAPGDLAAAITAATGLRARTSEDFISDTVQWFLSNSEDVGDVTTMLTLAITVGFGVTGVLLYIFTQEHLKQYAVLSALGATSRLLTRMIVAQAMLCALLGFGIGIGLCAIAGELAGATGYPFRMMWFTPLLSGVMVALVSVVAAAISARPALKLQPAVVFAGR